MKSHKFIVVKDLITPGILGTDFFKEHGLLSVVSLLLQWSYGSLYGMMSHPLKHYTYTMRGLSQVDHQDAHPFPLIGEV